MEYIVFILVVVILVILITAKTNISIRLNNLQQKIDLLSDELRKERNRTEPSKKTPLEAGAEERVITHPHKASPIVIKPEPEKEKVEKVEWPQETRPVSEVTFPTIKAPVDKPVVATTPIPPKPRKPGFFERNPDLEKFIGENLANKIGIGILVLGIGFFVKYAIDQDWINEIGRVFIGILCGGLLLGLAHYMRKNFSAFSSVLVGGGIAVLYLTIAIAFHEYQIFPQTVAFILMVIITGFTILLSLGYNRIELAVLAILGGFGAPFMVSTGEGNYVILFTYILILDAGMLVLAYFKKWSLINIIAYAFTLLLFGSWLFVKYDSQVAGMTVGAFVFSTLFYLIFFAMNLIWNPRVKASFKALDFGLLLSNTFLYYGAGMVILSSESGEVFKGLFTALLGVFNFLFAFLLYKNNKVDRNLVFLLIGLVLTFISLAAPVQLEGNYITLFWAAEAVLLLWLSQKSGIHLMKITSVVINLLMMISLLMDWNQLYVLPIVNDLTVVLNQAYITSTVVIISIFLTLSFLRNEASVYKPYVKIYQPVLLIVGMLILYGSQFLELQYQLNRFDFDAQAIHIITGTYNTLFILGLLILLPKISLPVEVKRFVPLLGLLAIGSFLLYYHYEFIVARNNYLIDDASFTAFFFHYIYLALLIPVSVITLRKVQGFRAFNVSTHNGYAWFFVFFYIMMASAELDHTVLLIGFTKPDLMSHVLTQNHKIGFPILWGLAAFLLIVVGLKTRKKHLRIISLSLLLITLIKLFFVDIRGISEGGKIAAFISLGVLLLIVSFMYQRLKKLLLMDEVVINNQEKENLS